jgi:hypothetical protein
MRGEGTHTLKSLWRASVASEGVGRGAIRVFYQELKEGDLLKLNAESNTAPTGGGARDLRVSPEAQFRPFFERMFPSTTSVRSKRGSVTVNVGQVRWSTDEGTQVRDVELWPPTDVRPHELRIAKIHQIFPAVVPQQGEGRTFVLLVQNNAEEVWGHYVSERDLRSGEFNERVASAILGCMDQTPEHRSVRGYLDLRTGHEYCHE